MPDTEKTNKYGMIGESTPLILESMTERVRLTLSMH